MTNARSEPGVLQATVGRVRGPAYEATTDFLSVEEPLEVRPAERFNVYADHRRVKRETEVPT